MSDRVTNAEVEDVLSSIRRLVSEDHRGAKRPKRSAQDEAMDDGNENTSRLVLTAALRVPDPDIEVASEQQPKSGMSIDSLVTDDTPLDVYHPNFTASQSEDFAEDGEDPAQESDSTNKAGQLHSEDAPDVEDAEVTETFDTSAAAPNSLTEVATDTSPTLSDVSTEAPAEIVDVEPSEDQENDPSEDNGLSISQAEEEALAKDDADDAPVMTSATQSVKAAALGAKIAALETAIGKISDTWEPDDPGESDYAGTQPEVMAWEDEKPEAEPFARPMLAPVRRMPSDPEPEEASADAPSEDSIEASEEAPIAAPFATKRSNPSKPLPNDAEVAETAEPKTESIEAEAPIEDDDDQAAVAEAPVEQAIATARVSEDEHLIDEEALRDLVSDIVRAELQGALGERITRNVRKLVRREIHRALVAQELE